MQFDIEVTQHIRVTLDESKFDEAFMQEFRESFFPFDTIEEHALHIGQLYARGVIEPWEGADFIEGYGSASEMGIELEQTNQMSEVSSYE